VISGRMHVCILALSNFIPCFTLEYQGKSQGLMKDANLESLSQKNPEISDQDLSGLYDNIVSYRNNLIHRIPIMKGEASKLLGEILISFDDETHN
jgi:polysaccharide pyruvyl transferase WcaK-like protein